MRGTDDIWRQYRCEGGFERELCADLRSSLTEKRAPAHRPDAVQRRCGPAAEFWSRLYGAAHLLRRGHSYTADEKRRAGEAFDVLARALKLERAIGDERAALLRRHYLEKGMSLSPREAAELMRGVDAELRFFETDEIQTLLRVGLMAELDPRRAEDLLKRWKALAAAVETQYITPGSGLPEREEIVSRYEKLARWFDVIEHMVQSEGFASLSQPERRMRWFSRDGLTAEGAGVAERAADSRRRLRAIAYLDVAAQLPGGSDEAERRDRAERHAGMERHAERLARELAGDPHQAALEEARALRRKRGLLPTPPTMREQLDPAGLPRDIPPYLLKTAPGHLLFVLDLTRGQVFPSYGQRLEHAARFYADLLGKECGPPRSEAWVKCLGEAKEKVAGLIWGLGARAPPGLGEAVALAVTQSQTMSSQRAGEILSGIAEILIPGYACVELAERWRESALWEKLLEGGFCAVSGAGAVKVVKRAAKGQRGPKSAADEAAEEAAELGLRQVTRDEYFKAAGDAGWSPRLWGWPAGVPAKYERALSSAGRLLTEEGKERFLEHLLRLERETARRARDRGVPREKALQDILGEWESRHGFKPATVVYESQRPQAWYAMLREGALFRDRTFAGKPHGVETHRLQWHVIMREMSERPESFPGVKNAAELFRTLGDESIIARLDWSGASRVSRNERNLWGPLFDSFTENHTSPEFLRKMLVGRFPGLGKVD